MDRPPNPKMCALDFYPDQNNVQLARSNFGVLVECFIKIAQAEEQECIRILSFNFQVLLTDGGNIVGHGSILLLLLKNRILMGEEKMGIR